MPQIEITEEFRDGKVHVVGLDEHGSVIQIQCDEDKYEPCNWDENLAEWGLHNLYEIEVKRLLALPGIRDIDRQVLEKWRPNLTEDQAYQIAKEVGMGLLA